MHAESANKIEPVPTRRARRLRWWILGGIMVLAIALFLWIHLGPVEPAMRVMSSLGVCIGFAILFEVWLLVFSGLRWRTRLLTLAVAVGGPALFLSQVRVREFTGDVAP